VVNARISDRSYPRYRRFRFLLRQVLANIDTLLAQSEADAARLTAIGAEPGRVRVAGNLKFDSAAPAANQAVEQLRLRIQELAAGPVVVFGSTVEGEEALLTESLRRLAESYPRGIFVLAPRHKERFSAVAALLAAAGIRHTRRSDAQWLRSLEPGQVLLLDTIGELAAVYALASVAFVGGSLAARGGHNILEPAGFAIPILVGPHTENFREVVQKFEAGGGVMVVRDANELLAATFGLLADAAHRRQLGERAYAILQQNQGASERTLAELEKLLVSPPPGGTAP